MTKIIKLIQTQQTYPLRSLVLRTNLPIETCHFDHDDTETTFHLGYFLNEQIISIATFVKNEYAGNKNSYQLRGMATHPDHRSKGYGKMLLLEGVKHLKLKKINQVWCNARVSAQNFYLDNDFICDSDVFIIETAGPHIKMYLKLT